MRTCSSQHHRTESAVEVSDQRETDRGDSPQEDLQTAALPPPLEMDSEVELLGGKTIRELLILASALPDAQAPKDLVAKTWERVDEAAAMTPMMRKFV